MFAHMLSSHPSLVLLLLQLSSSTLWPRTLLSSLVTRNSFQIRHCGLPRHVLACIALILIIRDIIFGSSMMAMGYFRAPRRLYGRKPAAEREKAALLMVEEDDDDQQGEAAAAAGAVPKGYFAVYVGAESRRFVVPTSYLTQPAFRELMERAAEEFGFAHAGGIRIPCREEDFQATVAALEQSRRRGGGGRARGSAAAGGPTRWARASF